MKMFCPECKSELEEVEVKGLGRLPDYYECRNCGKFWHIVSGVKK